MCEWKNLPSWAKEFAGLLLSGTLLFLFLLVVFCHLKVPGKASICDGKTLSMSSAINTSNVLLSVQPTQTQREAKNAYFDPVDAAKVLGPYLDKLGWIDIFILVFVWPIGMVFVRFSKSFSKCVCK